MGEILRLKQPQKLALQPKESVSTSMRTNSGAEAERPFKEEALVDEDVVMADDDAIVVDAGCASNGEGCLVGPCIHTALVLSP